MCQTIQGALRSHWQHLSINQIVTCFSGDISCPLREACPFTVPLACPLAWPFVFSASPCSSGLLRLASVAVLASSASLLSPLASPEGFLCWAERTGFVSIVFQNLYFANWRFLTAVLDSVIFSGMRAKSAFRLPWFQTLIFCMATCAAPTNICNVQSWCKRLASADVDRYTAIKSECTIRQYISRGKINIMADQGPNVNSQLSRFNLQGIYSMWPTVVPYGSEIQNEGFSFPTWYWP